MSMTAAESPWKVPMRLDEVPPEGRAVQLVADAAVRAAVARQADLIDLPRLEARFELHHQGRDSLRVCGEVSATVGQTCGVTLEPLQNEVNEQVDLVFSPPAPEGHAGEEPDEARAASEPLVGGTVDLGALAVEFLLLGIDPFPRKPGVEFTDLVEESSPSSPFAALAALKDRGGRKE